MGTSAMYACVCGRRGTREAIELHIAGADATGDGDDFGGDTQAHYLPVEPREPAPTFADMPTPPELPPPPIAELPRPIAESFQDMLRQAFEAGVTAATSGELFESWYQREVLR